MDLINFVVEQFKTNEVLTGIVGGGFFASILYTLREIPSILNDAYHRNYVWTFRINDIDPIFQPAMLYFSNILKDRTCRVRIQQDQKNKKIDLLPNYGTHYFWKSGRFIIITITEEKLENSRERKENISLKIYGFRTKDLFFKMLEEMLEYQTVHCERFYIYDYSGWWDKIKEIPERTLDNIFLEDDVKNEIIKDIEIFYKSPDFYIKRGLPHKRGYIFHGEAGTGKSSFAIALANHFKKNICYLDLNTIDEDYEVRSAFKSLPSNSILVLEDVDIAKATNQRTKPTDSNDEKSDKEKTEDPKDEISLSTVLQMMDGIYMKDSTIVIATTNYLNKLDKAFIRDGRFDMKVEFPKATREVAEKMILSFDKSKLDLLDKIEYPISQAELQNLILK
jgi:chaperone BCS1